MACGEDPKRNLAHQLALAERALKKGAKIFCTQELFRSQYFCQIEDHRFFALAETHSRARRPTRSRKLAKKYKAVIIASLFEKRAAGVYHNTAASSTPTDRSWACIARCTSRTTRCSTRSSTSRPATPASARGRPRSTTIGVLICWDQWFPEGARLTAMQGAEILFYPTAIGWHPSENASSTARRSTTRGRSIQRSHAIANGCYVCVPNRIGHEFIKDTKGKPVDKDGIVFWGQSFVASPDGQVVKRAPIDKETVMVVRLRPRERRVQPHALAVPARSPHRRLRRPHQALQRLTLGTQGTVQRDSTGHSSGPWLFVSGRVGIRIAAPGFRWPRPEGISFPERVPRGHRRHRRPDPRPRHARRSASQRPQRQLRAHRPRVS